MESGAESHGEPFLSVKISSYLCSYFGGGGSEMHFFEGANLKCTHVLKPI